MSGQSNQPPYGGWPNRAGGPSQSPIHYRPPSPWAPSPPPIISGPRRSLNSPGIQQQQYANTMPSPGRSTPISPAFGNPSGLRGTRGPQIPCPRPRWPGPQHPPSPQSMMAPRVSPSPPTIGANGPRPYRPQIYSPVQSTYGQNAAGVRSSPLVNMQSPELHYDYEYIGIPLEPPPPRSYIIYDDEDEQGPSTREIIANQSQDYVDEKLAEYQMTIFQLQGKLFFLI